MRKVYVDNSATSFPKAPGVSSAVKDFLDNVGCNVNRGGYQSSYNTALEILQTRKMLCELLCFAEPKNVVFTPGITYSLNMILRGFLHEGDHVITTSMEHNGVMRPLHELSKGGVWYDIAGCASDGSLATKEIAALITAKTKAVVMTHASNVCGTVLPIADVYEICRARGVKLIVDAAQTAGVLDIDMACIDALAFTAHKGLLAPQGLGGFIINSDMEQMVEPLITGGTGSLSHEITQPGFMPDKLESGTMNIPAIIGLKASLEYIKSIGTKAIFEKEAELAEDFIAQVSKLSGVRIVGKKNMTGALAVISLDFANMDNSEMAATLDAEFGIMTRCGLHCAPNAHKTLGTYPHGTVRFSFGHLNTAEEVEYIAASVKEVLSRRA